MKKNGGRRRRRGLEYGDGSETENCFDSLPDSLMLLIFSKVQDFKSLILLSLVSKRFAALVPQTDAVLLHVNYLEDSQSNRVHFSGVFRKVFGILCSKSTKARARVSPSHGSLAPYGALSLLQSKFQGIRSLRIELQNSSNWLNREREGSSFMKWKAVFGSRLRSCVILSASSFVRTIGGGSGTDSNFGAKEELSRSDLKWIVESAKCCVINASFRLAYYVPHDCDGTIQRVVVADDSGRGSLCMGREELMSFRRSCLGSDNSMEKQRSLRLESIRGPLRVKVYYLPILELPTSGYTMRRATVAVVRRAGQRPAVERDAKLLLGGFGDEETGKVYDEAVVAMAESDRKKTYALRIAELFG